MSAVQAAQDAQGEQKYYYPLPLPMVPDYRAACEAVGSLI
jgi:hypothetical protein